MGNRMSPSITFKHLAVYVDSSTSEGSYRYFNYVVDGTSSIFLNDSFDAGTVIHGVSQEIGGDVQTAVQQTQANTQLAEDWAILTGGTVDGTEFSAKHHAQNASTSAAAALVSENNASTSETNAAASSDLSEDWAILTGSTVNGTEYSSKHYSQQSASFADTSAQSADISTNAAAAATASKNDSEDSAAAALVSENNAATSEANAATSETNAAASYDQFDDRYLGSKSSAPTTDNDGDPLITGALYWDTTGSGVMRVWNGSAWEGIVEAHVNEADPHTQYMESANNLSDLDNVVTARENLSVVQRTSLTGSAVLPSGSEAQRDPTPAAGYIRFNSDIGLFEGYNGSGWVPVGSGATGSAGDQVFVENDKVVTSNYTIPSDKNAMTTGPVTVQDGVTVTISDGSRWVVI